MIKTLELATPGAARSVESMGFWVRPASCSPCVPATKRLCDLEQFTQWLSFLYFLGNSAKSDVISMWSTPRYRHWVTGTHSPSLPSPRTIGFCISFLLIPTPSPVTHLLGRKGHNFLSQDCSLYPGAGPPCRDGIAGRTMAPHVLTGVPPLERWAASPGMLLKALLALCLGPPGTFRV